MGWTCLTCSLSLEGAEEEEALAEDSLVKASIRTAEEGVGMDHTGSSRSMIDFDGDVVLSLCSSYDDNSIFTTLFI